MKKHLFVLLVVLGTAILPLELSAQQHKPKVEYVLICNSNRSYAYHRYQCSGLSHCRHGISRVTKVEAIKMGYQPCKICYK